MTPSIGDLAEQQVWFLLVRVRDEPLSLSLSLIQGVIEEATARDATVGELVSTLVTAYFGTPIPSPNPGGVVRDLRETLTDRFGDQIALVSGRMNVPVGTYGSSERLHHGPISWSVKDLRDT